MICKYDVDIECDARAFDSCSDCMVFLMARA